MKKMIFYILLSCMGMLFALPASAQRMPERGLVRKGNRQFAKERYERSVDSYSEALKHDSTSFEARYDLAGAMFRTERYAEAEEALRRVVVDSLQSAEDRAEAYFNLGNAQFAQQKLQEALQSFRSSLILNPDDMEAKYNYAYTKKLLEQQQNQNQNQDQNQDQNQNNDQNQNGGGQNNNEGGDNNEDKNDQNNDNKNNEGDQNQDPNQNQDQRQNPNGNDDKDGDGKPDNQSGQPPRSGMNEEQQQQLLNAIQAQEDKTQDKLDEKAKGVIIRGKKNW